MLYILNSAVLPLKEGQQYVITARQVSIQEVRDMLQKEHYTSAIGHEATAKLLSNVLGVDIPLNRIQVQLQPKDRMLAFLLKKRLPEGVVLKTVEELEQIGYSFWMFYIYDYDDPNPCIR